MEDSWQRHLLRSGLKKQEHIEQRQPALKVLSYAYRSRPKDLVVLTFDELYEPLLDGIPCSRDCITANVDHEIWRNGTKFGQ